MADKSAVIKNVFGKTKLTGTKSDVPQAGADNHLGILGSSGVWAAVTGNTFMPGFTPGQGQLLMSHDNTCKVGGSRNETVGVDETITIGANRTENVAANEQITIGANRTEQVIGNEAVTVGQNRTKTVALNEVANVGLTRTHSVGINDSLNVGAAQEISIGGLRVITVGMTQMVNVGTKHALSAGTEIELSAPKIILKATQDITIQCGAGKININAAGIITIEGTLVRLNC